MKRRRRFLVTTMAGAALFFLAFNPTFIEATVCYDPITVTNTNDDNNPGSLRYAIDNICNGGTIDFNLTYIPATITLTSGELDINKSLTITGPGASSLTISGNNTYRVFNISSGTVSISGLTISNGYINGNGGGIYNTGLLSLTDTTVSNNSAFNSTSPASGGGIYNAGILSLTNSTVSNNSIPGMGNGGGIFNAFYNLTMTNVTISGNSISGSGYFHYGGGLYNQAPATLTNVTFSNNSAAYGGGIFNFGNTVSLKNTIMANSPCYKLAGNITTLGHNLDSGNSCYFGVADLINTNPTLNALALNAPGTTETCALLAGSLAIDAGDDTSCPATDQRGVPRPQGSHCDIGAYEFIQPVTVPAAVGGGSITLTPMTAGCWLTDVQAMTTAQAYMADPLNYNYPYGLVDFKLHCPTPGQQADVAITFPGDISGMTYRKCGPTTPGDNSTIDWYTYDNVTVNGNTITLHLTDGQLGDDTGLDGVIVDQGGPGGPPVSVPTMNEWGMIIFMIFAGLGAFYYLRRQRKA